MQPNEEQDPVSQAALAKQAVQQSEISSAAYPPDSVERDVGLSLGRDETAQGDHMKSGDRRPSPEAKALPQQASPGGVPPEHRLLTTAEAAAWFKVTERTVETWRAKRLLPFRKIGRTIRFKQADLLQALDDRFLVRRRQQ